VLKEVVRQCADGTLPTYRSMETQLRRPRSRDESTSPPISMLGYATTLS